MDGQQQPPPSYGQPPPPQGGYGAPPPQGGYGAPPPQGGYGAPPPQQQSGQQVVVVQQGFPMRPSNYMALAIVSCIFCNFVCGIIAIIFSVMSSSAADEGDMESAKTRGKISCGFSLAGILTTIISIVVVILILVVFAKKAHDSACTAAGLSGGTCG